MSSTAHMVRIDALRNYAEVVRSMGGDPAGLLRQVGIEIPGETGRMQFIPYQKMAELLHRSALALDRPDFGLALAAHQGVAVLGPLEVAMRNSPTLGDAFAYFIAHAVAFSSAVSIVLEQEAETGRPYFRFEIYLSRLPNSQQVAEHAMALLHHVLIGLSDGKVRTRELWLSHGPVSPIADYRRYFGTRVEVNTPYTALFLSEPDLSFPLPNRTPGLFDLADAFIDNAYSMGRPLSAQVRSLLNRHLAEAGITRPVIARMLNLHPKTLERGLRNENCTFAALREEVRREAAQRYITETRLPLTQIAGRLGYSEPAVLTRSCRGWFGCTPRELRKRSIATPNPLSS